MAGSYEGLGPTPRGWGGVWSGRSAMTPGAVMLGRKEQKHAHKPHVEVVTRQKVRRHYRG